MVDIIASELLDLIYSAAIQPHLWDEVVERLMKIADAQSAWISRLIPPTGSGAGRVFNIDESFQDSYFRYYYQIDPISNVLGPDLEELGLLTDEHRIARPELLRSEFYNDFMRPQDADTIAMLHFGSVGSEVCSINLNRGQASKSFDPERLNRLRAVQPHLARAFRMSQQIGDLSLDRRSPAFPLLDVDRPLIVVESSRRVKFMNAAAEELVSHSHELFVRNAYLGCSGPAMEKALERSIALASSIDTNRRQSSSFTITAPDAFTTIALTISPLHSSELEVIFKERLVAIFAQHYRAPEATPIPTIERFGLSVSELRLVLALQSGLTLKQAASSFGVSYHTVRTQLAKVFDKTGVGRQVELLRLLSKTVS